MRSAKIWWRIERDYRELEDGSACTTVSLRAAQEHITKPYWSTSGWHWGTGLCQQRLWAVTVFVAAAARLCRVGIDGGVRSITMVRQSRFRLLEDISGRRPLTSASRLPHYASRV